MRLEPGTLCSVLVISAFLGCTESQEATPEGLELGVVPLATIAPEARPFGRIVDVELGADGLVYVLDGLVPEVRVFDLTGMDRATFGGPGEGPGEFGRPTTLAWGPSGGLWVLDPGNARLSRFEPGTGGLLESHDLGELDLLFPLRIGFAPGNVLTMVGMTSPDLRRPEIAWVEAVRDSMSAGPRSRADLGFVEWPPLFDLESAVGLVVLPVPFSGEPQLDFDPDGRLWYGSTASPSVHRWSPTAGIELSVEVRTDPRRVTEADVQDALESPQMAAFRDMDDATVSRFTQLIPERMPPIAGFFFDDRRRVWVVHGVDLGGPTRSRLMTVFDEAGGEIGFARAELTIVPRPRVRRGVMAAVIRDELGIESVRIYQISE